MRPRSPKRRQRVLEVESPIERHQLSDPFDRDGLICLIVVAAQDILQVHVPRRFTVRVEQDVPTETALRDFTLDITGARAFGQRHDFGQGNRDVLDLLGREFDRRRHRTGHVVQLSFFLRLLDNRGHFIESEDGLGFVFGLGSRQSNEPVRRRVECHDDGLEQPRNSRERGGKNQHRPVGNRKSDVFRNHFANDDVQDRDNQDRDDDRRHGNDVTSQRSSRERTLDEVVDRGFGHTKNHEGADRDSQLRRGEHEGRLFHRRQSNFCRPRSAVREWFDLRAPCGDDGEFRRDEECVDEQQARQPDDSVQVIHRRPRSG